jgi:hypothetical protein
MAEPEPAIAEPAIAPEPEPEPAVSAAGGGTLASFFLHAGATARAVARTNSLNEFMIGSNAPVRN